MEDIAEHETPGPGVGTPPADAGPVIAWLERFHYGAALVRAAAQDLAITVLIGLVVVAGLLLLMNGGYAAAVALGWLARCLVRGTPAGG